MPSAAVLSGGHAGRFGGRDKGALIVSGRSIRERQRSELSQLTDDLLLVAAADPRSTLISVEGFRLVRDRVADRGPLGGLDAALAAARDDMVIVVACDMPFVTAALLQHLVAVGPGYDIVVPRTGRGYHPLCAVYTRRCATAVSRRLASEDLAMAGLLEEMRTRIVGD